MSTEGDTMEPEPGCPDRVQMSLDPFGETPSPTMELSKDEPRDTKEINLNKLRRRPQRFEGSYEPNKI